MRAAGAGAQTSLTTEQVRGLSGQSFADVAAQVRTPADVALLLDTNITYDDARAAKTEDNYGAWSAAEVLRRGTGICRDQHALARDLLQNVMLGYSATDTAHAFTFYQDPKTGYWGAVEYDYPAEQLQARTPEEALMIIRPNTLAITQFDSNGPDRPSSVNGILYTPTARVYEQFMAGPDRPAGTGTTVSIMGSRPR
jgi:hypothetical protein